MKEMLSYKHIYHAGGITDILKHTCLLSVILHLNKKNSPYTFLDLTAGEGIYSIEDERALKTGEAEEGIISLLNSSYSPKALAIKEYLRIEKKAIARGVYLGSPAILYKYLAPSSLLILNDLSKSCIQELRRSLRFIKKEEEDYTNLSFHNRAMCEALIALTPPKTTRGAAFLDPSYEEKTDFNLVKEAIIRAYKKWKTGIYILWYPVLLGKEEKTLRMVEGIEKEISAINPRCSIEKISLKVMEKKKKESIEGKGERHLLTSNLLLINSPYKLLETMTELVSILERIKNESSPTPR